MADHQHVEAQRLAASTTEIALGAVDDRYAGAVAALARCWALLGSPKPHELAYATDQALSYAPETEARILLRHMVLPVLPVPSLQLADRQGFESQRARALDMAEVAGTGSAKAYNVAWGACLALCSGRFDEGLATSTLLTRDGWSIWNAFAAVQAGIAATERGQLEDVRTRLMALRSIPRAAGMLYTGLALIHAHCGDVTLAREQIVEFRASKRLDSLGWSTPLALRQLAELAIMLDHADLAGEVLALLSPYSGQLLVSFAGLTVDAAADRAIGQVLACLGRTDEAITHLEAGLALERSFGADALATRSAYWLARCLMDRDAPGDRSRALDVAGAAGTDARRLGMAKLERDLRDLYHLLAGR